MHQFPGCRECGPPARPLKNVAGSLSAQLKDGWCWACEWGILFRRSMAMQYLCPWNRWLLSSKLVAVSSAVMSGSKRPETETAIDGWIFVLAGAPCFELRLPCICPPGSLPRAWVRLHPRASGPGRACGQELGLVVDNLP